MGMDEVIGNYGDAALCLSFDYYYYYYYCRAGNE